MLNFLAKLQLKQLQQFRNSGKFSGIMFFAIYGDAINGKLFLRKIHG
jgi:hypothetical protein